MDPKVSNNQFLDASSIINRVVELIVSNPQLLIGPLPFHILSVIVQSQRVQRVLDDVYLLVACCV